jgi:hypothetical protein
MPFETRPGQGSLFKNRDRKNDKAPTLKGTAVLELADGTLVDLEIAAWTRESPKAGKWLSLSVRPKGAARKDNGRQPGDESDLDQALPRDSDEISF